MRKALSRAFWHVYAFVFVSPFASVEFVPDGYGGEYPRIAVPFNR